MFVLAEDLLRQNAAELAVGLSATRRAAVRRVLAQGAARGWTDATVRRRLAEVADLDPRRALAVKNFRAGRRAAGLPPSKVKRLTEAYAKRLLKERVRVLADHEMTAAMRMAQRMIWRDMQSAADYSPYAVRVTIVHKDERLCTVCKPEHGKRRSLKDITGGPPFHPRCRCNEEVQDRGIEKREDAP